MRPVGSPRAIILLGERCGEYLVGISFITGAAVRLSWLLDLDRGAGGGGGSCPKREDEGAGPPRTKALLRVV